VDGLNLRTVIKRARESDRDIPLNVAVKAISMACEGLGFAHAYKDPATGKPIDIIHRDISPDNILISRSGTVKVADFGLAKAANSKGNTQAGILKGKVPYFAPEIIRGQPANQRTDIYALGVTLFEMVAGRRPFDADNEVQLMQQVVRTPAPLVGSLRKGVPRRLEGILDRALSKKPEERYQTCRALQDDLDRYLLEEVGTVGSHELASYVAYVEVTPGAPAPPPETTAPDARAPGSHEAATSGSGERKQNAATIPFEARVPAAQATTLAPTTRLQVVTPARRRAARQLALGIVGFGLALGIVAGVAAGIAKDGEEPSPGVGTKGNEATLRVESSPPARVRVNGRDWGRSPGTLTGLPTGEVVLGLYDPEAGFDVEHRTTLQPGSKGKVVFAIQKETVELRITPAAKVTLDGKVLGSTPIGLLKLYEGKHRLRAVNAALGADVQRDFLVVAGEQNIVTIDLAAKPK
jgi:serine/threonine-protein kinase